LNGFSSINNVTCYLSFIKDAYKKCELALFAAGRPHCNCW